MAVLHFLCFSYFFWKCRALEKTCLGRDEHIDDLASVSLLQSHMRLDSSARSKLEPNRSATQKSKSSSALPATGHKVTAAKVSVKTLPGPLPLQASGEKKPGNVKIAMAPVPLPASNVTRLVEDKPAANLRHHIQSSSKTGMVASKSAQEVSPASSGEGAIDANEPDMTADAAVEDPVKSPDRRTSISFILVGFMVIFLVNTLLRRHAPEYVMPFMVSIAYIVFSSGLISINKYIMSDAVFPYALALTTLHMTTTWLGLFALYCFKPNMFPQMVMAPKGTEILGVSYSLPQYFVPIGCFFAISLFGANSAYHYCSVAFLQFMKETNVVWLFSLCVVVGSQTFSRAKVLTITWIVIGAGLAITGEMNFVLAGFLIQAMSQAGEVCKNVLGEWMMTTSNFKLDALTYTLSLAPMALIPLLIGTACTYDSKILVAFVSNFPLLAFDACLAVVLNVTISLVIKHCSAVAFILVGMVKDIFIVLLSTVLFGDSITAQQVFGFVACLGGIAAYSSINLKPHWWAWLSKADVQASQK